MTSAEAIVIAVLPPPSRQREILSPRAEATLARLGRVVRNEREGRLTADGAAALLAEASAALTSWGAPVFDASLLEACPRLRVIGHAAGTIKSFVRPEVFERGIVVTQAADTIALAVAEFALGLILMGLREGFRYDREMHDGRTWEEMKYRHGRSLWNRRVGLLGASRTARALIPLLHAFGCELLVYDPYLAEEDAADLAVRRAPLEEIMASCDVVSNHLPNTPETMHLVGAHQLGLLPNGALFVNTARAASVDRAALLTELRAGRIRAAIDVFDEEPLPPQDPLRLLPNVILTPHVAGATDEIRGQLGNTIAAEFERFFAGQPLRYQVTTAKLPTMA